MSKNYNKKNQDKVNSKNDRQLENLEIEDK